MDERKVREQIDQTLFVLQIWSVAPAVLSALALVLPQGLWPGFALVSIVLVNSLVVKLVNLVTKLPTDLDLE